LADPPKPDDIQLRGSKEEDFKRIEELLKKIEEKFPAEKDPPKPDPKPEDKPISKEYQAFIDEKNKFLKEKQEFNKYQKESLLDAFSKEEQEYYKDHSVDQLQLITEDRKQRKDGMFLTEPPDDEKTYAETSQTWDPIKKVNVYHKRGAPIED
jgi:hypothetical protein